MMFGKIAIVSIPVKDQNVWKSFYTKILGGKVVEEMPFGLGTNWTRIELRPLKVGRELIHEPFA
jgi:catechol 2,3-dioxygenase-like lactoylglutathione lyase family enzyme